MIEVQEKEEQKALVTRCKMENIPIVSIENSLQFPIGAVMDVVRPFVDGKQVQIIKCKMNKMLATLTSKRKSQGMFIGIPDLFLPQYKLFIEMKRRDGGVVSAEQEKCHEWLRGCGYRVEVCHGAAIGWQVICEERAKYGN